MRMIDADSLKEYIRRSVPNWSEDREIVLDCIANSPTIVERKKGTWVRNKDGVYCSSCYLGWSFITGVPGDLEVRYNYCPNCGSYNGGGGK